MLLSFVKTLASLERRWHGWRAPRVCHLPTLGWVSGSWQEARGGASPVSFSLWIKLSAVGSGNCYHCRAAPMILTRLPDSTGPQSSSLEGLLLEGRQIVCVCVWGGVIVGECVSACIGVSVYEHGYVCVHMRIWASVCVCVWMCMHVYVCVQLHSSGDLKGSAWVSVPMCVHLLLFSC